MGRSPGLAVTHWVGRYCHELSSSTQVGGERWLPALPMGPGRKQGQPSRRNATPACLVALASNLPPTNLSGYKMQSDSHRHKAASRHRHAAEQTASRLLSTASTTPGSPAGSAALSGCATGGLEQEEPGLSHPKVTFQRRVQVLTRDQELPGNLRTTQLDTHVSSENTTVYGGGNSDCFPSLHSLQLG